MGREQRCVVFLPLQGHFCYVLNNSEGVFCQNTPGSRSPGVRVTSVKPSTHPSPFNSPNPCSALTFSFLQNTHIILQLLCVCIAMLCSSLGTCTCTVQFLSVCVCDELPESHLLQQRDDLMGISRYSSSFCSFKIINS